MLTKKEPSKNEAKNSKTTATKTAVQPNQPESRTATKSPTATTMAKTPTSKIKQDGTDRQGDRKNQNKTRITIKYDVGFNNQLTIRGKGGNLNWDRGQPLKNVKADEWVFETEIPNSFEFKVLINDKVYEQGENHKASNGANIVYTPKF